MEYNIQEALRARDNAEKLFAVKDFAGAKNYALEAQMLCPGLEGIAQMVATFEIYYAAERKYDGEIDFYSILGMDPSAERSKLKKQYKKLAVLLHPDKNKTVGADGAFKLVAEAWTLLSDHAKRRSYDSRRNKQLSYGVIQTNLSSVHCSKSLSSHNRLDTFWTICTSCHVQYEYLRKYVNKRLSCKNCRGVFIAAETGAAPTNGSFPYSPWPYAPDNGHASHGYNGVTYIPTSAVGYTGNGGTSLHSGHGSECVSNMSFSWSSFSGPSAGVVDHNSLTGKSSNIVYQANGNVSVAKVNGKNNMKNAAADMGHNGYSVYSEPTRPKRGRPPKIRKVDVPGSSQFGSQELASKTESEGQLSNGNGNGNGNGNIQHNSKIFSAAPAFDARKLLIDKARTVIRRKLEEMRLASVKAAAPAEKNGKACTEVGILGELPCKSIRLACPDHPSELKKAVSMPIVVPDSDFHDFDKDRSEECFKPKQIWALYDEEDGMPRLYCLIRQVISVKPFKVHISYLSSKTDTEFGLVNWLDSGFTKSCGNFRAFNTDILDQVNIFSHLLSREKAGRGGCVRIYPKSGDIWAVYRNWSTDWNRRTPDKVRHQYEMVEVLDDYSEDLGVCVTPLIKLDGFKTVYQRNPNKDAIRWIPRREMLRFSHQVPSCALKGKATNLPEGCWDLDPAATPDELLQTVNEVQAGKAHQMETCAETTGNLFQPVMEVQVEENSRQMESCMGTPEERFQCVMEVQDEEKPRQMENCADFCQHVMEVEFEEKQHFQSENPAATPDEFFHNLNEVHVAKTPIEVLQDLTDMQVEKPHYMETCDAIPVELIQPVREVELEEKHHFQVENSAATPTELLQGVTDLQEEKPRQMESSAAIPVDLDPVMEVQVGSNQPFEEENPFEFPLSFFDDM